MKNSKQLIENLTKAEQCAELLLQDLQYLNRTGDAVISLLVLPEIEKAADIRNRLKAIATSVAAVDREQNAATDAPRPRM